MQYENEKSMATYPLLLPSCQYTSDEAITYAKKRINCSQKL